MSTAGRASLLHLIACDLARYEETCRLRGQVPNRTKIFWESLIFKAGFQAALLYRLSHWLHQKKLTCLAWFVARLMVTLTGAEIEFNARIGPGLLIAHPVGLVIGRGAVIGEHATLFQGVTLAAKSYHPDEIGKFPQVGNHCFLFAHAGVFGAVRVGDFCVVAAHAVVTKDVPDGALARGVPAKIVPGDGRAKIDSWFRASALEQPRFEERVREARWLGRPG